MDVTLLVNKADEAESSRRRPIIVVVVSNVTRSRDVVKMVLQKLGMDQRHVLLMQLVAEVNYRSHDRGELSVEKLRVPASSDNFFNARRR